MTVGRKMGAWETSPCGLSGLPPAPARAPIFRLAAGPAGIGPVGMLCGALSAKREAESGRGRLGRVQLEPATFLTLGGR